MRLRELLIYAFLGCVLTTEWAHACTCSAPASVRQALEQSSGVFKGRVTDIGRPFFDRIGVTKSGNYLVTFAVLKQWKGRRANSVVVSTRLSGESCGLPFQKGREYLVYVVRERNIQTGICTGTKPVEHAAQEIGQLDSIRNRSR